MPKNKNAYFRYRFIDQCLNNQFKRFDRQKLSDFLTDKCGRYVSVDCISRDISALKDEFDAPIEWNALEKYYFYSSAFSLTGFVLDDEEEKSLKTSLAMLDILKDTKFGKVYKNLIQRIMTEANAYESNGIIEFEKNDVKNGLDWFDIIYNAILEMQTLKISYKVYGKEAKEHIVSPYMIKEFRNRFYLVARNHSSKTDELIFCYGMDRIKVVKKSKESFITTKGFNSKTYFKHSFGITRKLDEEPLDLVLKFNEFNAHYILSKPLHHSQKIIEQTEDFLIVSIKVYESHELNMAILSHGAGVEVIGPKSYMDYIKGEAAKMIKKYK